MRIIRNILSIFIVVAFAVMATASLDSDAATESKVANQAPDLQVSATRLYADYDANEVAADQRYKGKAILVTGIIDDIGKDIMDTMYITLTGDDVFGSVQCFFADSHASELGGLRKGMSVSVKGLCSGKMMNVMLKGCVLE